MLVLVVANHVGFLRKLGSKMGTINPIYIVLKLLVTDTYTALETISLPDGNQMMIYMTCCYNTNQIELFP